MLRDILDERRVRRVLRYALLLLGFQLAQTLIFSRISILGVRPLLPILPVIAVGFFEGGMRGGLFGLAAGLWSDALSADTVFLFTALYALLGFCAGLLTRFYLNRRFFSFLLLCAAALTLTAFCQALPIFVRDTGSWIALLLTGLLQTLWTLPFAALAYYPAREIAAAELLDVETDQKFQPPAAPAAARKSPARHVRRRAADRTGKRRSH